MFIKWEKPDLNQQVKHINLTLSLNVTVFKLFKYTMLSTQCNDLCDIAHDLNSTVILQYVTLKMTDVSSKRV